MFYEAKWDWGTLILYLFLSVVCCLLLKHGLKCKNDNRKIKLFTININSKYLYYLIVLVLLVFFMCTRLIKDELGGADTLRYMYFFDTFNYTNFVLRDVLTMQGWEYLFFNSMYLIRIIGGNYFIFSIIIYSILIICYIFYFDKNVKNENECFICLLFILPYLKSMNIVRNCLAAAIGLLSIEAIKKDKTLLFFITFILAYLNHYISIVIFFFWLFCKFVPEKMYNSRGKSLTISFLSFIVTLIGIPVIKNILLMTRYAGYIDDIQFSPYGYIVYAIIYALIMIFYKDFIKEIELKNHKIFYKMIVFLSIIVAPFAAINGTQRLLLYFEIPRFIMYGDLYHILENKVSLKYKKLFKYAIIAICICWIVFRIWKMYDLSKIMPYKNILFDS